MLENGRQPTELRGGGKDTSGKTCTLPAPSRRWAGRRCRKRGELPPRAGVGGHGRRRCGVGSARGALVRSWRAPETKSRRLTGRYSSCLSGSVRRSGSSRVRGPWAGEGRVAEKARELGRGEQLLQAPTSPGDGEETWGGLASCSRLPSLGFFPESAQRERSWEPRTAPRVAGD